MTTPAQDSALLQAIMQAAVDAIIVSDAKGKITRANRAAERLFGYDRAEIDGNNINMLMPKALADLHDGFMSHYIETGEKRIIGIGREVEGLRKDQSVFPLHLSVGQASVEGEPMFIAILHDLTQRNATRDALARSQRLDAIGQMTGGIAHDFNNLLTVVIGNLELLELRGFDPAQLALLRDALEAAELGADLTSRLMVFARQSNLKPAEVDLREVCQSALAILKRTMGAAYRISTDFAPDVSTVLVDPVQLQSALVNLALNARDAMPDGGDMLISIADVTIDDTYMAQETDIEPGAYVRLSVSDNGDGMSAEAQKRAFEPFFTTKAETGGNGLGLATVYGFVRQSGGHVTLYSELGHGTSFGLYFPTIPAEGVATAPKQTDALKRELPIGNNELVLVVEDNPKVRRLSVERIRNLGFQTAEADTGDAAYAFLETGAQVDVVFSDLVMPGSMNGYELAAKIASGFPDVKVLLTSGYASDVVSGSMERSQSYEILHKPYRQADLAIRLQALLDTGVT